MEQILELAVDLDFALLKASEPFVFYSPVRPFCISKYLVSI